MNKKAIAILGAIFILIVGTLGFLIYSKYSGSKTPAPSPSTNATSTQNTTTDNIATTTTTTQTNPSNIVKLTDDQVVSPALFFDGSGLTYFDHTGNLYKSTLQNNNGIWALTGKKQLDIPLKSGISKILWPSKGDDFIAQFSDSSGNSTWSYFNSKTGVYTDLPKQVESIDWMPSGDKVMYVWLDNGKASLSLGNPDTSGHQTLAAMWENDDQLHVSPDATQALYFETQTSAQTNAINSVTSDGKVFKGLVKNGFNSGVLWSPDSQKFLFGKKDPSTSQYQLWLYNLTSGEVKPLGLSTTVAKTVWDKDSTTVYAAVPTSGTIGDNSLTVDSVYKINTATLEKKQYPTGSSPIDGRDLFLSAMGDNLFFRNAQDGGLYYLDLTQ